MRTLFYSLITGLVFIANDAGVVFAQDDPAKDAMQQLEQVQESAKKGDATSEFDHSEAAEKDLIKENKEKPYQQQLKQITGTNQKAKADKAAFNEIEKAKRYAREGRTDKAAAAAKKAEVYLQQKEQAK